MPSKYMECKFVMDFFLDTSDQSPVDNSPLPSTGVPSAGKLSWEQLTVDAQNGHLGVQTGCK